MIVEVICAEDSLFRVVVPALAVELVGEDKSLVEKFEAAVVVEVVGVEGSLLGVVVPALVVGAGVS